MLARSSFTAWPAAPTGSLNRSLRLAVLGTGLIATAVQLPYRAGVVAGSSMLPTLHPGQTFLYRRSSGPTTYRRGEVVVVWLGGQRCVKRVFAVGGDTFWSFNDGVKDEAVAQILAVGVDPRPWKRRFPGFRFQRLRIPTGSVFVVGDGVLSMDSRQLGPVPDEAVVGTVLFPGCRGHGSERVAWTMPPPRPPVIPRS